MFIISVIHSNSFTLVAKLFTLIWHTLKYGRTGRFPLLESVANFENLNPQIHFAVILNPYLEWILHSVWTGFLPGHLFVWKAALKLNPYHRVKVKFMFCIVFEINIQSSTTV